MTKRTRPSTIFYTYQNKQWSCRDLVGLLDIKWAKTDSELTELTNRRRRYIKYYGVESALERMATAKPPRSNAKLREKKESDFNITEDFDQFDPDLNLKRQIEHMQQLNIPDEEIIIKLRTI